MIKITKLFFIFVLTLAFNMKSSFVYADGTSAEDVKGYKLIKKDDLGTATLYINCYDSEMRAGKGGGNQAICNDYYSGKGKSTCEPINSTYNSSTTPVFACMTNETRFCVVDSDCTGTNKPKCVIGMDGNTQPFMEQFGADTDLSELEVFGICAAVSGDASDNAITTVLCKLISLLTGGPGKVVCVIVVSVVGIMFFLGKVQWSLLLSVGGGVAFVFGAETIIGFMTGSGAICRV